MSKFTGKIWAHKVKGGYLRIDPPEGFRTVDAFRLTYYPNNATVVNRLSVLTPDKNNYYSVNVEVEETRTVTIINQNAKGEVNEN